MVKSEPSQSVVADAESGRNYLIRSEERLAVQTERVLGERVRLEKYLVTETRTITVEVTHEEVRLVREPHDPGRAAAAASGGKNSARWMYVNREEVVITKKVVPVERVRLEIYPVMAQQQITEIVRKEQIAGEPTLSTDAPADARFPHDQHPTQ